MQIYTTPFRTRIRAAALGMILVAAATACSAGDGVEDTAGSTGENQLTAESDSVGSDSVELASVDVDTTGFALFDSSVVHDIRIEFDQDAYDEMIATYETTGEKDWIEATITIDGTTIENVGLRLKGNSSLFGLTSETAQNPEDLPWLIRIDKFVDDQTYQGYADLVIRSNSTETALNEAVALELLGLAGLPTEEAIATAFTINGGETELRLAIEHPDEIWEEQNFDSDESALYKADSEGDYSYRGDDPEAYEDVFDQKSGDDDLEPLTGFLDFINNSDDATFASELEDRLDVDAFATYLAFQDLVDNFDDIDGRGNNSYLQYDYDTGQFTVVNWDLNLAFGTANVAGGPGGAAPGGAAPGGAAPGGAAPGGAVPGGAVPGGAVPGGAVPGGAVPGGAVPERPEGLEPPAGGAGGRIDAGGPGAGGPGQAGSNVLVERFLEVDEFAALYADATAELTETLYNSGAAEDIIDTWVGVLSAQAADLVDVATIQADAAAITASIEGV